MPPGGPLATWRILTPTGTTGGVAVIQIDGDADAVLARLNIAPVPPGAVQLRSIAGIDTGLIARWTPSCLHLMPHAGPGVLREVIGRLREAGIAEWSGGEPSTLFPEAADAIEDRMLSALARAASPLAIDVLLAQPRRWRDYQELGGPGPDPGHSLRLSRLIEPPLVVMVGPANIGKSTLTNALAGSAVSIVSEEPGTTRDHVGVMIDFGGLVVRLVDTPGLRPTPGPIEREAAEIALDLAARSDLVLLCGDAGLAPPPLDLGVVDVVRILMRADLGPAGWASDLAVSGMTGEGIEALVRGIRDRLVRPEDLAEVRPWRFWPG